MRKATVPPLERAESFDLSDLLAINDVEQATDGKVKKATLRWQLRSREENGLDVAVVRIGRKDFLHMPTYARWLARQGGL